MKPRTIARRQRLATTTALARARLPRQLRSALSTPCRLRATSRDRVRSEASPAALRAPRAPRRSSSSPAAFSVTSRRDVLDDAVVLVRPLHDPDTSAAASRCFRFTPLTASTASSVACRMPSIEPSVVSSALRVFGPMPGHVVETRRETTALADLLATAVGEAVRFVARRGEEEELGAVRRGAGWGSSGPGRYTRSTIFSPVDVLALLGEPADAELVQPEIARGGERDGELPAAAVDDEEVRQVPAFVLLRLALGGARAARANRATAPRTSRRSRRPVRPCARCTSGSASCRARRPSARRRRRPCRRRRGARCRSTRCAAAAWAGGACSEIARAAPPCRPRRAASPRTRASRSRSPARAAVACTPRAGAWRVTLRDVSPLRRAASSRRSVSHSATPSAPSGARGARASSGMSALPGSAFAVVLAQGTPRRPRRRGSRRACARSVVASTTRPART